ncbi:MAG TPA: hypothetical protein VFZ00_11135 [Solirubrobacter sp.]|nr:hypothetical protein [Solirubrobacter sp.]
MTQRFVKKLGEPHAISVEVTLTEAQRAERRKASCDLLDQKTALAEEAKLKASEYRQRVKELDRAATMARQAGSTGKDTIAVLVQDFLTRGNEVVSVAMTADGEVGDEIVRRTATAEELQEELFGGSDEEKPH